MQGSSNKDKYRNDKRGYDNRDAVDRHLPSFQGAEEKRDRRPFRHRGKEVGQDKGYDQYDRSRHRSGDRDRRDSWDRHDDRVRDHRRRNNSGHCRERSRRRHSFDDQDEDCNWQGSEDDNRRGSGNERERNRSNSNFREDDRRHHHEKRRRLSDPRHDDRERERRPRFPGPFEIYPADYVLDGSTGYFYEKHRDFFHDPKSKLYYHNGTKRYYSFDKKDDRFISVESDYGKLKMKIIDEQVTEIDKGNDLIVQALQGSQKTEAVGGKKKISIMIRQKPKKVKKGGKKDVIDRDKKEIRKVEHNQQRQKKRKEHHNDMDKWSKRIRESDYIDTADNEKIPYSKNFGNPTSGKVAKTKQSGRPVCLLCRRKFESVENIQKHFLLSELHKYNVSKLNQNGNNNSSQYVDRARNRRTMYEKELPTQCMDVEGVKSIMASAPSLEKSRDIINMQAAVRPEDNLGVSNVGNKMLQKLGWKEGQSLGRTAAGRDGTENHLKQDWERIESMALNGRKR